MKTVALVPIKMSNERLPGKNTKAFSDGKPLIKCILETLCTVPELDGIYVYCSNPDIQRYFPNGKIQYLRRSETLDQPSTKINEVLMSFAEDIPAAIYVLAHATAPFISRESISAGIQAVASGRYDSALSVLPMQEFLWEDGRPINYDPAAIPRTQDLKPLFTETTGLYVYTSQLIKERSRRVGSKPYFIQLSQIEACDINTPEDFEMADAIYMYITRGGVLWSDDHSTVRVIVCPRIRKGGAVA